MPPRRPVSDRRILHFIAQHPNGVTPRQLAERFYTTAGQLQAGARLMRMTRRGLLNRFFRDGWHYYVRGSPAVY